MKLYLRFSLIAVLIFMISTAVGCSYSVTGSNSVGSQSDLTQSADDVNDDSDNAENVFQPPAYVTDIDLSCDDPSNSEISFEYDSQGRISVCYYENDGAEIYQSYTYTEASVEIYTFCEATLIDEAYFEYTSDDENIGFVEKDGYYFKGISFEPSDDTDEYYETITEEEAVALVRDKVGEGYGLLPEGLVERNGEQYYSIRVTYLVDEYHSSTLTQYLVKADGSEIVDYFE